MDRYITRILKYGTLISCYLLIGSVLLQVFARFFLPNTPAWTEEASRLFFVYTISFAAGLALKDQEFVYLEFFFDRLPARVKSVVSKMTSIITAALFICITFFAGSFVVLGLPERSPSMKFSMAFAFFSIIILAVSMSYFAIRSLDKREEPS